MDIRAKIGQRLVVGFHGFEMDEAFKQFVRDYKLGNIILFARNVRDKDQLFGLCNDIQALVQKETGHPAFITIDQEGGVVSRITPDCAVVPGAMAVAASGDPKNAFDMGVITGRELNALGCNFNLAPDMDVNSNAQNPVIGVRSYGDTPQVVSDYGCQMILGMAKEGVLACAKHFPGHGDTAVDSHIGLPTVDKSREELEACELAPFRAAIAAGVPAIMTTHILFPQIEKENLPATMSRTIMTDILRGEMGFDGLILSDCMMMEAISTFYGTVEGCKKAFHAGVDMVFVCHDAVLAAEAIQALEACYLSGGLSLDELDASVERILKYRAKVAAAPRLDMNIVGSAEHRAQVRRVLEQGVAHTGAPLPSLGANPIFLGCQPFRQTIASNPEAEGVSFAGFLQKALGGLAQVTSVDPDADEIAKIVELAKGHSCIVLGTYNGHIRRNQMALADALSKLYIPMVCVALRNPYDLGLLPPCVSGLAAFQYDEAVLDVVARILKGDIAVAGKLTVQL